MRDYLCEVCGRTENLSEDAAYAQGWDYPPFIGQWGVVSPRTCGSPTCGIQNTAYWAVISGDELTEHQVATIERIQAEVYQ